MLLAHIGTVNAERSLQILHRIAAPAAQGVPHCHGKTL